MQGSRNEEDFVADLYDESDLNTENNYHFGDARTNEPSRKTSASHLVTLSDDHSDNLDLNGWKTGMMKKNMDEKVTSFSTQSHFCYITTI